MTTEPRPTLELPEKPQGSSAQDHALAELRKKKAQDKRARRAKKKGTAEPKDTLKEQMIARVQAASTAVASLNGPPELEVLVSIIVRDAPDLATLLSRMLNQHLRARITNEMQTEALVAAVRKDPTGRGVSAAAAQNQKRTRGGIILP